MTTVLDLKNNFAVDENILDEQLRQQAQGAFVGLAVGDALGATVEFMSSDEIQQQFGIHKDIIGGGWLKLPKGQVTDDTTMTFALAEAILCAERIDAMDIAEGFSNWMKAKPIDIGNTVKRGIIHYRYSGDSCAPEGFYDAGNGACMRVLGTVLATLWNSDYDAIKASKLQAHITHNNPTSDAGIECVTKLLRKLILGHDKFALQKSLLDSFISDNPEFEFRKRHISNPSGYIVHTLQAVLQAFFRHNSFEDILIDVVNRGGDADTTGAIAGMLCGAYYGLNRIPQRWLDAMDKLTIEKCRVQADQLLLLSMRSHANAGYIN